MENYYNSYSNFPIDPSFPLPPTTPHVVSTSSSSFHFHEFPSSWSSFPIEDLAQQKSTSNSKSHSQAEKRRRDRINSHLSNIRKLIPRSDKMDKAALLGSVIEQVKELKQRAIDINKSGVTIPTEIDEITVDSHTLEQQASTSENKTQRTTIKASICCEDQPELFREINRTLKGLKLKTIRADIASIGGRIKSILILCNQESEQESVSLNTLKQSLHLVLNRISSSSSSSMASYCRIRSKRQRLLMPSHHFSG